MFRNLTNNLLCSTQLARQPFQLYSTALLPTSVGSLITFTPDPLFLQSREYAARKGIRIKRAQEARRRSLLRKATGEDSRKKREGYSLFVRRAPNPRYQVFRYNDRDKPLTPKDDVYYMDDFRTPSFSLKDIVSFYRETHHPTVINYPDAIINCRIELNMKTKKKTKFMDYFLSTVTLPYPFELKRRLRVVAVAKTVEEQEAAKAAGATYAGGLDIIKNIKTGLLHKRDYDHIVVHTDMLIPLTEIRGILDYRFPNKLLGNFGTDIVALVKKFVEGYTYFVRKNNKEEDFGFLDLPIGRINMEHEQVAANLLAIFDDAERHRPAEAPGQFPQRVFTSVNPTEERFLCKFWELSDKYVDVYAPTKEELEASERGLELNSLKKYVRQPPKKPNLRRV